MRHLVPRGRGITELHCFVHRGHVRSYGDASPRSAPLSWTRRPGQYHRDYGLPPSIHGCLTLVTDWNMRTSPDTLQWASRLRHTQGFSFEAGLSGQGTLSPPLHPLAEPALPRHLFHQSLIGSPWPKRRQGPSPLEPRARLTGLDPSGISRQPRAPYPTLAAHLPETYHSLYAGDHGINRLLWGLGPLHLRGALLV